VLAIVAASLLAATGCATQGGLVPKGGYEAARGREHPLSGKIWSPRDGAYGTPDALRARLTEARLVAIGETHDHPDHHRVQALLLGQWLEAHRDGAVAFEMLDETQAPALVPPPTSADELAARVHWDESGWPDFALYRPVFETALARGATIVAAHPRREHVRASMGALPPEAAQALALDTPLPAPARAALVEEIRESHCGHAPEDMVEGMVRAQSFKDAWMARAMVDVGRPVVLIAGKGHIGEAGGVPLFLSRRGHPDVLTVALVEVRDALARPEDYPLRDVDFVVFTPRTSDADACEQFREQLEQMKKSHAGQAGR